MKKSIQSLTKVTQVLTLILLCLTFSCQQLGKEAITEEEAKVLTEGVQEIWNEGNLALADELLAPDFVEHLIDFGDFGEDEDIVGIDAYKEHVTNMRTIVPDIHFTTEEIIVKDDKIVWRWTYTGTNTEPMGDIPPTGKKLRLSGISIVQVVNEKFAEEWTYHNEAAFLRQLGFTITPPK